MSDEKKINDPLGTPDAENRQTRPKRDMSPEAVARRRRVLQQRRKKQRRMRMIVLGSMAVICILVVVLIVAGLRALFSDHSDNGKASGNPTDSAVEMTAQPTPEATPAPELPLQVDLQNTPIENLDSLSTENTGWGYGPSRDESNRPVDAVQNQEKYGQYNAHFVEMTDEKVIYLTMDEGYEYGYTPTILDVLKEMDCPVTFFITLPFAESNPDLVQRMIDEGHVVGNHSVSHPSDGIASLAVEDQDEEILGVHNYVLEHFNYKMWLFRYPTGAFSEQSLARVSNLNYQSVFWSFAHADYDVNNQPDVGASLEKALDALHPGAIYLLHAVSETNTTMLRDFIQGARDRGYTFKLFTGDPSLNITSSLAGSVQSSDGAAGGTGEADAAE